jgi:type IV pilus assembly protein PilM
MLQSKSFLGLDFGAGSLKMAEFEMTEAGALRLKQFGFKPLGMEGSLENAREGILRKSIQELLNEKQLRARKSNICAPGFHVFSKFVKLPPVDSSKVTQIIQYEAQQNVPFPLEEVVWDYQILGSTPGGELEVLLVAIKAEVVEGIFRTAESAGLRLELVDVSHAALCNAFRFNYPEEEGCTMLLDIGAKTSNLLFFEKGKVYSRTINIGANSITQDFASEAKLRFAQAEQIKKEQGFVSLGGAYEEPENPHQAAISKIARQVLTRLHIQVNQTIQFFRGQQGGSAPQRLYLAGGASVMPYTSEFFAEKLNMPVDYFNPFRNIEIDPEVDLEELAKVAQSFGEVVGLGLRNMAQCPVELNLVPKSIRKRQQFEQKKPYFLAALFSLVLVVFAYGWFYERVAAVKAAALEEIRQEVAPLQAKADVLSREEQRINRSQQQINAFTGWLEQRFFWPDFLQDVRNTLLTVENSLRQPGMDVGVWIETFGEVPAHSRDLTPEYEEEASPTPYMMDPMMMERYGLIPPRSQRITETEDYDYGYEDESSYDGYSTAPLGGRSAKKATNQIDVITAKFRAMNLNRGGRSLNGELAYAVEEALQQCQFLDSDGTKLVAESLEWVDATADTFSFSVNLKLKEPIQK